MSGYSTETSHNKTRSFDPRNTLAAGEKMETADFESVDVFAASIDSVQNPIEKAEGKAVYLGNGCSGRRNVSNSSYQSV